MVLLMENDVMLPPSLPFSIRHKFLLREGLHRTCPRGNQMIPLHPPTRGLLRCTEYHPPHVRTFLCSDLQFANSSFSSLIMLSCCRVQTRTLYIIGVACMQSVDRGGSITTESKELAVTTKGSKQSPPSNLKFEFSCRAIRSFSNVELL